MGAMDNEHRWPQSPSRNSGCVLWRAVTLTQLTNRRNCFDRNRQKLFNQVQSIQALKLRIWRDLFDPCGVLKDIKPVGGLQHVKLWYLRWVSRRHMTLQKGSLGHVESWLHACIWWFLQCQKCQRLLNVSKEFGQNWELWWILANRAGAGTLTLWITLRPLFMALAGGGSAPSIYQT